MRTYLILKEKGRCWNEDPEIQALLEEIGERDSSRGNGKARLLMKKAEKLDHTTVAKRRLPYERLDQLTMEVLLGVR